MGKLGCWLLSSFPTLAEGYPWERINAHTRWLSCKEKSELWWPWRKPQAEELRVLWGEKPASYPQQLLVCPEVILVWIGVRHLLQCPSSDSSPYQRFQVFLKRVNLFLHQCFHSPFVYDATTFCGGSSSKEPTCQYRRHKRRGCHPSVWKIPWRRAWQPAPVFLPELSHRWRSMVGYSPRGVAQGQIWRKQLSLHALSVGT